jgi:MOSC domain-containing protein YiiM
MVRKLNVVDDAQADLAGHGGEQRAVFVYQMDAYQSSKSSVVEGWLSNKLLRRFDHISNLPASQ